MSLAQLQEAIAALVCDEESLQAYEVDPDAWSRSRLGASDACLLARLDASSLRLFHEIHARDRAYFIEAVLPLTIQRLGADWSRAYFAKRPYGDDDVRAEAARFVEHLADDARDEGAFELARYELAKFRLLDEPAFEPRTFEGRAPERHAPAPGIAILPTPIHLPSLVEDPLGAPTGPGGVVLLRRDSEEVASAWIEGLPAQLLRAVEAKNEARLREIASTKEGRSALLQILADGAIR